MSKKVCEYFEFLECPSELLSEAKIPYFGTENEIEAIISFTWSTYLEKLCSVTVDHSLRNNGKEIITVPLPYKESVQTFSDIRSALELGENPYSHRTSTHVHLNVLSLDLDQLKHLVLLYALFEPVFFAFVGAERKRNIHCVPLNYTLLPRYYREKVSGLLNVWSKYTAFNLLPVKKQGTVEFRHLYGTGDVEVYRKWLQLISELYLFAQDESSTWLKNQLFAGTSYRQMQEAVLPSSLSLDVNKEEQKISLLDVKLAFI